MSYVKPRDWVEDFADENGNYANECVVCKNMFRGHKRRVTCKLCTLNGPPTESEQAQAIAEIKRLMKTFGATVTYSYADMHTAISLVDSQAQKIAASATVMDGMHAHTVTLNALYLQAEQKISEQAKEIAKLKRQIRGNFEPEDFHNQILQDGDPLGQEFR